MIIDGDVYSGIEDLAASAYNLETIETIMVAAMTSVMMDLKCSLYWYMCLS